MHNRWDIKKAADGEADVLFWNSCDLKILVGLDSHGDWLGAELVACERRGDRSATNQNYSEAADWSLAADDSQQLGLTSRERLQAVSFSSAVSLMGRTGASRQRSNQLYNVQSKLGSKTGLCAAFKVPQQRRLSHFKL